MLSGYSAVLWLIVMLFPRLLATLFAQDSAFLDYTAWALRIFMATSVVMGIQIACQQTVYCHRQRENLAVSCDLQKNYPADSADLYSAAFF